MIQLLTSISDVIRRGAPPPRSGSGSVSSRQTNRKSRSFVMIQVICRLRRLIGGRNKILIINQLRRLRRCIHNFRRTLTGSHAWKTTITAPDPTKSTPG